MSVSITIICDGCGWVMAGGRTAAEARKDVRQLGGRAALADGKDLCGNCVAEGRQPE